MAAPMPPKIAYLSQGKIHLQPSGEPGPKVFESKFAESLRARAGAIQQRNAWKRSWMERQLGGQQQLELPGVDAVAVQLVGLTRGRDDAELFYSLNSPDVSGVFAVKPEGEEKRLYHSAELVVRELDMHPARTLLACSVAGEHHTSHLALMHADGTELMVITDGDSIDRAPRWVANHPKALVYESVGVGRNEAGQFAGLGPAAVHHFDLSASKVSVLAEHEKWDFLQPQVAADGALYCVRRPREPEHRVRLWPLFLSVLLLPFNLVLALVNYLNLLVWTFNGKPLIRSGRPEENAGDLRRAMLASRLARASRKQRREFAAGDPVPAQVPGSWELVRRRAGSDDFEVLARGVVSFDVATDGSVVYSNGNAVFHRAADGTRTKLCEGERIEQVRAL